MGKKLFDVCHLTVVTATCVKGGRAGVGVSNSDGAWGRSCVDIGEGICTRTVSPLRMPWSRGSLPCNFFFCSLKSGSVDTPPLRSRSCPRTRLGAGFCHSRRSSRGTGRGSGSDRGGGAGQICVRGVVVWVPAPGSRVRACVRSSQEKQNLDPPKLGKVKSIYGFQWLLLSAGFWAYGRRTHAHSLRFEHAGASTPRGPCRHIALYRPFTAAQPEHIPYLIY